MHNFTFEAIGTLWQINSLQRINSELKAAIAQRVEEFDKTYSRFRSDSLVAQWREPGEYELPPEAEKLLSFYRQLYDVSDGLVTPLIGQTMEQAGYGGQYSLQPQKLTHPPGWNEAIEIRTGKIIIKRSVVLDFGAAGKGYLVDLLTDFFRKQKIEKFVIDASGDIFVSNLQRTIGLEDPDDAERVLGMVEIKNKALCASAGNRRKWKNYHHIINPKTLRSVESVKATWVMAENTMLADGIATALFFVSPEILQRTFEFEYAMIEGENMRFSKNFKAQLFTKR